MSCWKWIQVAINSWLLGCYRLLKGWQTWGILGRYTKKSLPKTSKKYEYFRLSASIEKQMFEAQNPCDDRQKWGNFAVRAGKFASSNSGYLQIYFGNNQRRYWRYILPETWCQNRHKTGKKSKMTTLYLCFSAPIETLKSDLTWKLKFFQLLLYFSRNYSPFLRITTIKFIDYL